MSCFWDGLRGKVYHLSKLKSCEVRGALQAVDVLTTSVPANGKRLTNVRLQENYD